MYGHTRSNPHRNVFSDRRGRGEYKSEGYGHNGGGLLVCAKRMTPQKSINVKCKQWNLLGLTSLAGDAIMYILIFTGVHPQAVMETGMDIFVEQVGEVSDEFYFNENRGSGERYPGEPTYNFQRKDTPCLIRWIPKGSITSEMLVDIVESLGLLKS